MMPEENQIKENFMNLKTTRLKDLPAWFREKLDCDAELKIKLEAIQLLKKANELALQKIDSDYNPPQIVVAYETRVYERYLLLIEESIRLNNNMEITFAERLQLTEELNLTEIGIMEDLVACKRSLKARFFWVRVLLRKTGFYHELFSEIPLLPPEKRS